MKKSDNNGRYVLLGVTPTGKIVPLKVDPVTSALIIRRLRLSYSPSNIPYIRDIKIDQNSNNVSFLNIKSPLRVNPSDGSLIIRTI